MRRAPILLAVFLILSHQGFASGQVEQFQLPNGLRVIVEVAPLLPLVNVTCLYRVGGANERPGITGIAHYVEHMAFRATENISESDITGTIERIGGRWNGYTWIDQTLYAATVPTWALDTVLAIEAERMSRVVFDPTEFERERTSVIAELQGYENDPASILWDLAVATSFEIHPYRYNIIGWLTDVLSLQADEAHQFYKDYYGPNNAVIAVVGDVNPADVREKVQAHFGALRPSARSADVRVVEPVQKAEKRLELRYPGSQKNLTLVFRAPRATDADFPTLLVLDGILAGGRGLRFGSREALPSSPLQKAIETAGGHTASTSLTPSRHPYVYGISVTSSSDSDLLRLQASIDQILQRLGSTGPTESELVRARRQIKAKAAYEVDGVADVAHRLAYFEALGSWQLANSLQTRVDAVTDDDIRRYVNAYLKPQRRTVALHIPGEVGAEHDIEIPKVALPDPATPPPSPVPELALKPLEASSVSSDRRVLPNGTILRAASRQGSSASLRLRLAFGSELDPPGKEGLAITAARLVLDDPNLTSRLAELGAQWSSSAESVTTYSSREYFDLRVRFLPGDSHQVIRAVARALKRSAWQTVDIQRVQSQLSEELTAATHDARWIAEMKANEMVDPSWRPPGGTQASLNAIRSDDVIAFLSDRLVGGAVTVGLACPGDAETLIKVLSDVFSELPAGNVASSPTEQRPSKPVDTPTNTIAMEGKTQTEIVAALPGIERSHPDYLPLQLLNYILGETGYAGRLGKKLVKTGLTYSVYAIPQSGRRPGPLLIRTSAAPANLEESLSRIRETIRNMADGGVEEWEWKESQAFRLGRLTMGIDAVDGLALALVESEYFGEDTLDFDTRSKHILGVTRERLNEVARRYLRPDLLGMGIAGAPLGPGN